MKLEFSRQIFEKSPNIKFAWKSVQWEPSCSIRTDGRTDMTKLIVAFRNFANAPKIQLVKPFKVYTWQLFLIHVSNCK